MIRLVLMIGIIFWVRVVLRIRIVSVIRRIGRVLLRINFDTEREIRTQKIVLFVLGIFRCLFLDIGLETLFVLACR